MSAARPARRGIGRRVMILSATGMVATMVLLGLVSARAVRYLEDELRRSRMAVATAVVAHVDDRLTDIFGALQGLANSSRGHIAGDTIEIRPEEFTAAYLQAAYVEVVFLAATGGQVLAVEPTNWPQRAGVDLQRLLHAAGPDDRPHASGLVRCGEGDAAHHCISLIVPVRDWQGRMVAVVGAVLDPRSRRFGQMAGAVFAPALGPLDLVDADDRVIVSSVEGRALRPRPRLEAGTVASLPLRLAEWRVIAWQEAGHPGGWALGWTLLWLAPLLLGIALLFAWGAGRSVSRPLETLTGAAERLAEGDLETPIPRLGSDEVGRLGQAFERMRVALKASLDEVAAANAVLERRVDERTRELARANADLHDRERIRQQLLRKVISAQEDERKRLARELHDETTQTITALAVRLEIALAAPPEQRQRELDEARALASRSLDELRRLMHDLRPSALDDLGLVPALQWYAERHLESRGLSVRFDVGPLPDRLPPELETAVFRGAQEALNNIAKHARADMVLVEISARRGRLCLDIEDDGAGFDAGNVTPSPDDLRGLGLLGMRERIELFGGTVKIDSAPGRGTQVSIRVPLPAGIGDFPGAHAERQATPDGSGTPQ